MLECLEADNSIEFSRTKRKMRGIRNDPSKGHLRGAMKPASAFVPE